jgi:bifunctional N-acetylglucosamine-1-phosphate-uridyltransferase/glucosamine-1-phosphate-acetyltransferase GlmU-like protein
MLTVEIDDPTGLGRIIRNGGGKVAGIVEEKVASGEQKNIHEINTGCFVFNREFLEEYLPKIGKNETAQEYYLTDIVEIAVKNNKKIEAYAAGKIPWRGVNRPEELEEARRLVHNS